MNNAIKLVIAIPTAGSIKACCTYSLMGLIGKLTQGISTRPEASLEISTDMQISSVIHSNREQLVRRAIDNGYTHLVFIDDDMRFPPNILDLLFRWRQPIVAVNYCIKKFPIDFVAVDLNGRRIVTKENSVGLQEIAYTGFGVSLFETRVFKETPQPWFQPVFVPDANCFTTEDNPCFEKIRKAGFTCYIDHEASRLVGHMGDFEYSWNQWKQKENVDSKQTST